RLADFAIFGVRVIGVRHIRRRAPAMADVRVDEVDQAGLGDPVEHLAHFEVVVAALAELETADADAKRHRIADAGAYSLQHLDDEADALARAAAPPVGAFARDRRQERVPHGLV